MFVSNSKYRELKLKHDQLEIELKYVRIDQKSFYNKLKETEGKYRRLFDKWDNLVDVLNEKGGQKFLDHAVILDEDLLRKMIQLCHPDKHQGKQSAVEVTQFLNKLKARK